MRSRTQIAALVLLLGCGEEAKPEPEPFEELSGGATTVRVVSRMAFAQPLANLLAIEERGQFFGGNAVFNFNWVTAPSSTEGLDGLGPTFNARSCSGCHERDGRGAPPTAVEMPFLGLLLRLSVPGSDEHGGPLAEPNYGGQFNHQAILGVPAEGDALVSYEELPGGFADGAAFSLRRPSYTFRQLAFGAMHAEVMVSPRVAPAIAGLGLLEAVPEPAILALADPDDVNGDGISGRANYVWDPIQLRTALGRFGWKANQVGLEQQNTGAFLGDMGLSSPHLTDQDCPAAQTACAAAPQGGSPEVEQQTIDFVTFYTRTLAIPARRDVGARDVLEGKALFREFGCARCHTPTLQTAADALVPQLADQTLHPYTDLLLHDMGEGLADGRPDFLASGSEWRTAPLWGLGLIHAVNDHTFLLHDGRARNAEEAILWHGGEAEQAREAFRTADERARARLLAFLASL